MRLLGTHIWVVVKIFGPFLGTLHIGCLIRTGIRKGTIILTTTHLGIGTAMGILASFGTWGFQN